MVFSRESGETGLNVERQIGSVPEIDNDDREPTRSKQCIGGSPGSLFVRSADHRQPVQVDPGRREIGGKKDRIAGPDPSRQLALALSFQDERCGGGQRRRWSRPRDLHQPSRQRLDPPFRLVYHITIPIYLC